MTHRTRKTAYVLTGAVALSSAAYALGSQAGDGSAVAARNSAATTSAADGPRGGFGLDTLATKLGVTEAELRTALDELRPNGPKGEDHRQELAAALAAELDVPVADVTAALEKLRPERDGRRHGPPAGFAAALGKALDISTSKVQSALDEARDDRRGPPRLEDLATALGVSTAKLRTALGTVRPQRPPHRDGRDGRHRAGPPVQALADELGVDAAKVRAAFAKLRSDMEASHEARRDEFATALAAKLGLPVSRVKEVLASLPHPGPHRRP